MTDPDPSVRMPSLDGLRALEAAARLGSFERAAEELGVTASAVSKRIATLEDLLGAVLLSRAMRGVSPTAVGREYLGQVAGALAALSAVPLHRRSAQRLRRLKVSSPPTFARQVLVPHLAAWRERFPEIELEVVLSVPYLDGGAPDADVDVRNGDLTGRDIVPLMDDVVMPMASPGLVARMGRPRCVEDLAGWPLLRTPLEPWLPWWRAAGLTWAEPHLGPRLVDLGMVLEAAAVGLGVALARPALAVSWVLRGELEPLLPLFGRTAHRYYAVSNTGSPDGAGFVGWLQGVCQAHAHRALEQISARTGQTFRPLSSDGP